MGAIRTNTIIRSQKGDNCLCCEMPLRNRYQGGYCSAQCRAIGQAVKGDGDQCWLWPGPFDEDGYGRFTQTGVRIHAHRAAWMAANDREIPAGMNVCHTCDNPPCCNPAHLWLGTTQDNTDDMMRKGRKAVPRGEDAAQSKLTEDNVRYIRANRGTIGPTALARKFGVQPQCIYKVWYGLRWKHVA